MAVVLISAYLLWMLKPRERVIKASVPCAREKTALPAVS